MGEPVNRWLELKIHSSMANTTEQIDSNIERNLDRPYTPFNGLLSSKSGAVAVVGSGPSLKANWQKLKKFRGDLLACNAAFQFLLERGITPNYFMCFDADRLMLEFMTPVKGPTYLISSRCPPEAFDLVKGCDVVMWHAAGDLNLQAILERRNLMEPMVTGGSAAVTRAMHLAHALGYREIHLWGADSSFQASDTHIRQSTTVERRMQVMCNKRVFECAPWMAQQAEDFKVMAPQMLNLLGCDLYVHGDGLIPHIAMSLGCKTDLEPKVKQVFRDWKWKAKTLWQHL
jgi:hypothetical protein